MPAPSGFAFSERRGEVRITHRGKLATTLRGDRARDFLADVDGLPEVERQEEMARLTGNYRRGNEREAKSHPRNR